MLLQVVPPAAAAGPFAALSLIVAPGILTNACSVLVMSTSNRVGSIVWAAGLLVRETRLAVIALRERVLAQQARFPAGATRRRDAF